MNKPKGRWVWHIEGEALDIEWSEGHKQLAFEAHIKEELGLSPELFYTVVKKDSKYSWLDNQARTHTLYYLVSEDTDVEKCLIDSLPVDRFQVYSVRTIRVKMRPTVRSFKSAYGPAVSIDKHKIHSHYAAKLWRALNAKQSDGVSE